MAALKDQHKFFIVQCLACYDTPTQVVYSVKDEFGLTLERAQIQLYDPTKAQGKHLSQKYREIFEATRKAFIDEVGKIPVANQAYRLRKLQQVIERAERRGNDVMLMEALEQAAKEVGGMFTNKFKVGSDEGNPLMVWLKSVSGGSLPIAQDVTDDDDGELIEHPPQEQAATAPVKPQRKKRQLIGRD